MNIGSNKLLKSKNRNKKIFLKWKVQNRYLEVTISKKLKQRTKIKRQVTSLAVLANKTKVHLLYLLTKISLLIKKYHLPIHLIILICLLRIYLENPQVNYLATQILYFLNQQAKMSKMNSKNKWVRINKMKVRIKNKKNLNNSNNLNMIHQSHLETINMINLIFFLKRLLWNSKKVQVKLWKIWQSVYKKLVIILTKLFMLECQIKLSIFMAHLWKG